MKFDLIKEWAKLKEQLSCEHCTNASIKNCEVCIHNDGRKNKVKVKKVVMLKLLQEVIDEKMVKPTEPEED